LIILSVKYIVYVQFYDTYIVYLLKATKFPNFSFNCWISCHI